MALLSILLILVVPVTASPQRPEFVEPDLSSGPEHGGSTRYLGLVAIAAIVPIAVIGMLMYLYRRKHGHFPTFALKRIINERIAASRRRRQGGVWRPGVLEEGLPKYTLQASSEELSLGTGRKGADEDEITLTNTRESRQGSISTTEEEETVEDSPSAEHEIPTEKLPPYIPPPPPAVLAEKRLFGRGSQQWLRSVVSLSHEPR